MKQDEAFRVGIISLIMLILIGILLTWKSSILMRTSAYRLVGEFSLVNGLLKGAEVRYRGYQVGRVSKIIPKPNTITVHFFVKNGIQIPKESVVRVVFDGLIGEKYVSIKPKEGQLEMAKEGDVIYGYSTAGLADFVDVAAQNLENTKEIVVALKNILTSDDVSMALKNMVLKFEKIATDLSAVMDVTKQASVKSFGKNLTTVAEDLAMISTGVKGMLDDVKNKQLVEKIDLLITNLAQFTGELTGDSTGGNSSTAGMIGGFRRIGNVLSELQLKSSAQIQYFKKSELSYFHANLDLQFRKKYLRFGVGNRLGVLQLLHLQQGIPLVNGLSGRFGIVYSEPGIGFDYEFMSDFGVSLDIYNLNNLKLEVTGMYRLTDTFDISGFLTKDSTTGLYDNYAFGLTYHP